MTELTTPTPAPITPAAPNAQGGGQEPVIPAATFNQADVDRIVTDRLARQKAQFGDVDALKVAALKWGEHEAAQKTADEKRADEIQKLTRERDEALAKANDRLIRAAFLAEAAKAGALHPGDVYALADRVAITIDDAGEVKGVSEAVKAIVDAGRIPLANNRPAAPRLDGGAGQAARQSERDLALTDEELKIAQRLGIPAEKYAARKREAAAKK